MKTLRSSLLLLALCATTFLTTSCDKDKKDPDPRDAFVGKYDMEGQGDCEEEEYELQIEKDPKSATGVIVTFELYEEFGADEIPAEIKSGKLIFDTYAFDYETDEGDVVELELDAEGELKGKTLTLELELSGQSICDFEGDKK